MSEFKCRITIAHRIPPKDRTMLVINGTAYMNTNDDKLWKLSPANLEHFINMDVSAITVKTRPIRTHARRKSNTCS